MTSQAADLDAVRTANEATVRTVMELMSAGSYDAVNEHLHDDFVFELPYGPEGFPDTIDKAGFGPLQSATFSMFSAFTVAPHEFHHLLDPDGLVAEYRSDATVAASGKPYKNRYIGVFRFLDGKVVGWREFHNPEIVSRALQG